jgi:hypothetical protein
MPGFFLLVALLVMPTPLRLSLIEEEISIQRWKIFSRQSDPDGLTDGLRLSELRSEKDIIEKTIRIYRERQAQRQAQPCPSLEGTHQAADWSSAWRSAALVGMVGPGAAGLSFASFFFLRALPLFLPASAAVLLVKLMDHRLHLRRPTRTAFASVQSKN